MIEGTDTHDSIIYSVPKNAPIILLKLNFYSIKERIMEFLLQQKV